MRRRLLLQDHEEHHAPALARSEASFSMLTVKYIATLLLYGETKTMKKKI